MASASADTSGGGGGWRLWRCGLGEFIVYMVFLSAVAFSGDTPRWDARMCYFAGQAYASGLNPYDNAVISRLAHTDIALPYVYPPPTLLLWAALSKLGLEDAINVFSVIQLLLLALTTWLWVRGFLKGDVDAPGYAFFFLGYNGATIWQLVAGNTVTIEQTLVWLGLYFFLRGKTPHFCASILAAAAFKVVPIVFLALLLFSQDRRRYWYLLFSAAVFSIYIAVPFAANPDYLSGYSEGINAWYAYPNERGTLTPSSLPLMTDLASLAGDAFGVALPGGLPAAAHAIVVLAVFAISFKAFLALRRGGSADRRILVFFACVVFALTAVRFKNYQYTLLIPPTLYILRQPRYVRYYLPLLAFSFAIVPYSGTLTGAWILAEYYPLLVAYVVWALYLVEIFSREPPDHILS
jgi:hypothetical protein